MHVSRFFGFLIVCCFHVSSSGQTIPQSPDQFLPHRVGEQFTPHHLLVDYFQHLASATPSTMKLERYGFTNENRPLYLAFFSSPENMARLEQIRQNNLRLARMLDGEPDMNNPVAIVWLSMSVHGNEASGAECSMPLAWRLATQTDPQIKEWLQNTVVIVDPSVNPDGYDRYTHWNRMSSNLLKNTLPEAREHREPWPGGRVNHYYFDLNRDWAWASQVESRQRLVQYHRWLPHVHPDIHEQGIDAPYYFAPAAEPMHDYITPFQRDFQTKIGQNHAHYFDQKGWMYFTKEVFDLFYPSYGDTYPMYNGGVGMTYEQAGGPRGGRNIRTANGDTLSLHDRVAHHLTTSLSTIETTSKYARSLVENFADYYKRTGTQPQGPYKAFVIRETNHPDKVNELCAWLDLHQIRYGRVGAGYSGVKAFDYTTGKEISASVNPNDLVISAYQPKSVLVQVLFEPVSRLQDSMTYDITAWSIPFAQGLDAYALKERIEPKRPFTSWRAHEIGVAGPPYAWCVHRRSFSELKFLAEILQKGVKVRTARSPFMLADQQFAAGALVINRGDNRAIAGELDGIIRAAAAKHNVLAYPIQSGFVQKGPDLGSQTYRIIQPPAVAILYGEEVDENAYGHIWYYFERELGYPITPIEADRLHRIKLGQFSTIIVPNGYYDLDEKQYDALKSWVKSGGILLALEGGVRLFADKEGFELKTKAQEKDSIPSRPAVHARERDGLSDNIPGAIVKTKVDNSHPLAYGIPDHYFSLKTNSDVYGIPEKSDVPIIIEDTYQSYGFIGARLKPRLKKTPVVCTQKSGGGEIVYFIDSPVFRSFWWAGKLLLGNAVFYGGQ